MTDELNEWFHGSNVQCALASVVYLCVLHMRMRCMFVIHMLGTWLLFPMKRKIKVKLNCMQFVHTHTLRKQYCGMLLFSVSECVYWRGVKRINDLVWAIVIKLEQLGCSRDKELDMRTNTHTFHSFQYLSPTTLCVSNLFVHFVCLFIHFLLNRNAIPISVFCGK